MSPWTDTCKNFPCNTPSDWKLVLSESFNYYEGGRMAWLKDILRVANGLSLVAKEALGGAVRQSQRGGGGGNDLLLLLQQSLIKKAILSATNVTGLTKGKIRPLSVTVTSNNIINNDDTAATATSYAKKGPESVEPPQPLAQSDSIPPVSCVSDGDKALTTAYSRSEDSAERIPLDLTGEDPTASTAADPPPPRVDPNRDGDGDGNGDANGDGAPIQTQIAPPSVRKPRERRVPSTPFSRALG